jgi:hypothetical protein
MALPAPLVRAEVVKFYFPSDIGKIQVYADLRLALDPMPLGVEL